MTAAHERLQQQRSQSQHKFSPAQLGVIGDAFMSAGLDIDEVEKLSAVKLWQVSVPQFEACPNAACVRGVVTDGDGVTSPCKFCHGKGEKRVGTKTEVRVALSPSWEKGPQWPVVQPGKPYVVKLPPAADKTAANKIEGLKTAVVLPDMQIGYWVDPRGNLHPVHDEAALDVALQILRAAKPDLVVLIGDNLDFPEFGKYRQHKAFYQTTQASIHRATLMGYQVRAAAPDAEIVWLAGNHEERLPNFLIDNAMAAFGLKKGLDFEGLPVLTVPNLCRFEESGITWLPGYPANAYWINDRLRVIHGDAVKQGGGKTAATYLNKEATSTIYGHIHRVEQAMKSAIRGEGQRRVIGAFSPGCLCKVDGSVPGHGSGYGDDGTPVTGNKVPDWQQGLAIVRYEVGDGNFHYEGVSIFEGAAIWMGRQWEAQVDADGYDLDGNPSWLFPAIDVEPARPVNPHRGIAAAPAEIKRAASGASRTSSKKASSRTPSRRGRAA